jgi:hypothetical protein
MGPLLISPKAFIFRALMDFRRKHPLSPFMPVALLAEQLKIHEDMLANAVETLAKEGQLQLHPMWPHLREFYISEAFEPPAPEGL